jgi:hypothetical protein
MTEITPTEPLASLLARYRKAGGVIQHILIDPGGMNQPPADIHRAAALFTLNVLARQIDEHFAHVLQMPEYHHRRRNDFFRLTVNPDLLTSRLIFPDEFLGL